MCRTAASGTPRPPTHPELADIVRAHGPVYRRDHSLSRTQGRALSAIALCRTPALGGRADTCDRCGAVRITNNSCRNRHCPKCQTADTQRWIPARHAFLFPVRALSRVFRARFLDALHRAALHHPALDASVAAVARPLRRRPWVVYCQPPQAGPDSLLDYLARYTHRVALSNDRLLGFDNTIVRLCVKDYADRGRLTILALPVDEFLRRFLLHVLPPGFVRVRSYGLLANRGRRQRLQRCRALLGLPTSAVTPATIESVVDLLLRVADIHLDRCPVCHHGRMHRAALLPPLHLDIRAPPPQSPAPWATPCA